MTKADATRGNDHPEAQEAEDRDLLDQGLRGQKRMAARFVEKFRGQLIYTPGREWLAWTGSYWKRCDDARPWQGVHQVCQEALEDLRELKDNDRDNLYKDIRTCDSDRGTQGVLAHASRAEGIRVRDDELNNNSHIFVFKNGTFDLDTGEFRDSNPKDLMTLSAGCDYDPKATCPTYDGLMELYQPDEEIRDYLHRMVGAAMEGKQNLQNLVTWYGATGGNGKGTTMRAWQNVFGTFAKMLPVEALLSKGRDDSYRDQKAQLQGVRLVFATEPDEGSRFNTGTVKALTGGDKIVTRAMYKATVEFDPTWLIVMATNTRVSTPNDGGMARRLKEIPWQFTVRPDQMRSDLDEKLQAEVSGIANRILMGWWEYRTFGIQHPQKVEDATREYLEEVDPIARFLEECTKVDTFATIQSSKLYQQYKMWCDDEGIGAFSNKRFSDNLSRRGFEKKHTNQGKMWNGISTILLNN